MFNVMLALVESADASFVYSLKPKSESWESIKEVKSSINDWMDYYNNDRYQWE